MGANYFTDWQVLELKNNPMDYYINHRHQWGLKRKTPKAYGDMLRNKNYKKDGSSLIEQPSNINH